MDEELQGRLDDLRQRVGRLEHLVNSRADTRLAATEQPDELAQNLDAIVEELSRAVDALCHAMSLLASRGAAPATAGEAGHDRS